MSSFASKRKGRAQEHFKHTPEMLVLLPSSETCETIDTINTHGIPHTPWNIVGSYGTSHGSPTGLRGLLRDTTETRRKSRQNQAKKTTRFSLRAKGTSQWLAEFVAIGKPSCRSPLHRFGCRDVCGNRF